MEGDVDGSAPGYVSSHPAISSIERPLLPDGSSDAIRARYAAASSNRSERRRPSGPRAIST
jgi:hypothetical protein